MKTRVLCLAMALTGLLAPATMAATGVGPQPDALVRYDGNGHSTGHWKGNDVYNADKQQLHEPARKRSVFEFKIQNDGHARSRFYVGALYSHKDDLFGVTYYAGGTDITDGIEAGTYRTGRLKPGKYVIIKAVITEGGGQPPTASLVADLLVSNRAFVDGDAKTDGVIFTVGELT